VLSAARQAALSARKAWRDHGAMTIVPEQFEHRRDTAQFRRAAFRPGVELYRAHIVGHAFAPHSHEAYGIGAIESGVERFRYRGAEHLAPCGSIVTMNPGELHTGRAETADGWRYRMVYLDREVVAAVAGTAGWWFADAVRDDAAGAQRITRLIDAMWHADEPLAFDMLLLGLIEELRRHARGARAQATQAQRFDAVVDHLRANLAQRLTLNDLAGIAGLSPFHFLRCFRQQYHVSPQKMLMALRLDDAKRRLLQGEAPAQVAAATGLADQAHLTHAFRQRYGVTPARYQRQVRH
jgi:AraC-like DNA-binding protein